MKLRRTAALWLLGLVAVPLLLLSVEVAQAPRTSDFGCFWTSGRMVLDGADPYDTLEWGRRHSGTYRNAFGGESAPFCGPRWPYPLWTALFFAPWGALPLETAAWLWQLLLWSGAAGGIALIARATTGAEGRRELALLAVISQPFWLTVMAAQLGGVLLLMLGTLATVSVRSRSSAAVATALLLKPHVLAAAAAMRVVAGGRRAIATSAVIIVVTLLACEAARPRWWAGWLAELLDYRRQVVATEATSLWNLSGIVFGDVRWAIVPIVVTLLALLWARGRRPIDDLAAATTFSLVATPYAGSHDQLALVLPWAVVLGHARARDDAWSGRVFLCLLACASILPWILYAIRQSIGGHEATNALTPLLTAGLLVVAQRGARSGRVTASAAVTPSGSDDC